MAKYRFDQASKTLLKTSLVGEATGFAFFGEPFAGVETTRMLTYADCIRMRMLTYADFFFGEPFAVGAERLVFRCTEIKIPQDKLSEWYTQHFNSKEGSTSFRATRCGLRLVAKEAKDEENLALGRAFHEQFARIQVRGHTYIQDNKAPRHKIIQCY